MTAMAALVLLSAWAEPTDASLAKDAIAVLSKRCAGCHGGAVPRAGFNVLDRKSLLKHIVPGKPDSSELFLRVASGMMPPGTAPKPTMAERTLLRKWITAGAPAVPPPPPVFLTGDDHVLGEVSRDWAKLDASSSIGNRRFCHSRLLNPINFQNRVQKFLFSHRFTYQRTSEIPRRRGVVEELF